MRLQGLLLGLAVATLSVCAVHAGVAGLSAPAIITTIAGREDHSYTPPDGDGGPAVDAKLNFPWDVAVDQGGVLYLIDDSGHQVRAIDRDGYIRAVTARGSSSGPTDGAMAIDVTLSAARGLAIAQDGSIYVGTAATGVYRITPDGRINRVAGHGMGDEFGGDGGPATLAGLSAFDVDVGQDGSLYIADAWNNRVRKVSPDGIITTIAGSGEQGNGGDGGPATAAQLDFPREVMVGADGELFISSGDRVRKVLADGTITTFAGGGTDAGGETALAVLMARPDGLAFDLEGNLYVSDRAQNVVRRVAPDGSVEVVVGAITDNSSPAPGFAGDGGPATEALLANPSGIAVHGQALYIADSANHRIRKVAPLDGASTIADFDGDGASDIAWRNAATGSDVIWLGADGDATQPVRAVRNTAWEIVATGDFDGDAVSDLFWRNRNTGANALWPGAEPSSTPEMTVSRTSWHVVGAGDFDGDGHDDLFWRDVASGRNAIWPSGQPGNVSVTTVRNLDWQVAGVGDFDSDGLADVLWRNPVTGRNVIWRHGDYADQQAVRGVSQAGWTIAGVGDFDEDQVDDVLWRNLSTGANVAWLGADSSAALAVKGVRNQAWQVAAIGDYDGDGTSDLFWRNAETGANVIWNAADYDAQRGVDRVSNLDWQVVPLR